MKYSIGKLLEYGQFGYTYVVIDKDNENGAAVNKIDKSKVICFCHNYSRIVFYDRWLLLTKY